jgi:hypothetical protein
MPNHVSHRVVVTGPIQEVTRFRNTLFKIPDRDAEEEDGGRETFDFNQLVAMPASVRATTSGSLTNYGLFILGRDDLVSHDLFGQGVEHWLELPWVKEAGITTVEGLRAYFKEKYPGAVPVGEAAIKAYEETGFLSWYEWSLHHWGTKWNAYHFAIEDNRDDRIEFRFDTAWSSPSPIFDQIAETFPQLHIEVVGFDEGWGFGIEGVIENGVNGVIYAEPSDELYERVYGEPPEHEDEEAEAA